MRLVLLALVLAAAPVTADESVPAPPRRDAKRPPVERLASIERTQCLGTCPSYVLTVFTDGTVEYLGRAFVKLRGARMGRLDAAELAALSKAFLDADYFAFADRYTKQQMTDNPYCNTSFNLRSRQKSIEHYYGDRSAPPALNKLEDRIDELVHVERYIGSEAERDALERQGKLH